MKHKVTAKVLVMLILLSVWACVDQQNVTVPSSNTGVSLVNGRVAFASVESFKAITDGVLKMSLDDQVKWAHSLGHSSMYDVEEMRDGDDYRIFSPIQKLFLNKQGLVQIGDNVILHRAGVLYFMKAKNYDDLSNPEDIIAKADRKAEFGYTVMQHKADGENARLFNAPITNGGGPGYGGDQFVFYLGDGSQRKFVTEFVGWYSQYGQNGEYCPTNGAYYAGDWYCYFYMNIKLEGRTSSKRSWSSCPDTRSANWNVSFTNLTLPGYDRCNNYGSYPQPDASNVNSYSNINNGLYQVFITSAVVRQYNHPAEWDGTVTGTVYQLLVNGSYGYTLTF